MAVRTTSNAVSEIIEVESSISLTPFIEAANALVTQCCGSSSTYTDDHLELIERWLSAHFYAVRKARKTSEKVRVVSANYQSKVDLGFDVTHYGQMAMRLDYEGGLAELNNQTKKGGAPAVGVSWLGKTQEETAAGL